MVYRIMGGLGLLLLGITTAGWAHIDPKVAGIILAIAGIALLDGI